VPTLELVRRLDARSKTDQMVPYDTSAAKIVHRLLEHEQKTLPVIERYKKGHTINKVDGSGSFEEVFERIAFEMANGFKSLR
jgi:adenylate kinase